MAKIEGSGAAAVALSALRAQQARMRVIAENMANSSSTGSTPGAEPYRRQMPIFKPAETSDGAVGVVMTGVRPDPSAFGRAYEPGHPAADAQGYVKLSNVSGLVEGLDMKNAQRSYEANLNMIENLNAMDRRTLDLIKRP